MNIPAEIWEAILLDTDVESLPNICFLSSTLYRICSDSHFWKERFRRSPKGSLSASLQRSTLPIINPGNNFGEWFREYQRVSKSRKNSDILLTFIESWDTYPIDVHWPPGFDLTLIGLGKAEKIMLYFYTVAPLYTTTRRYQIRSKLDGRSYCNKVSRTKFLEILFLIHYHRIRIDHLKLPKAYDYDFVPDNPS